MRLYRAPCSSPRGAFAAAPRRARASAAPIVSCSSSAAAEKKESSRSSNNESNKKNEKDPVAVVLPPLLSPDAKSAVALLRSLGTADVVHTGGETFLSHLVGVYRVLKSWEAPEYLCLAGLAHSIYSTEGFQGFSLDCTAESRVLVAKVVGREAERLAHVFCCTDRGSQVEDLFRSQAEGRWKEEEKEHRWRVRRGAPLAPTPVSSDTAASSSSPPVFVPGTEPENPYPEGFITLNRGEWLDFTTLTLADWMEQVESAALKESTHFK